MDLLWIVLLGVVVGAVLGGLGGGGAILTVPGLVYVVGQSGQDATTSSLVIVGLTATVGMLSYISAKRVRWGLGATFGLVGLPAAFIGTFFNHRVDENVLLLSFSGLMVVAALAMIGAGPQGPSEDAPQDEHDPRTSPNEQGHEASAQIQPDRGAVLEETDTPSSCKRPPPILVTSAALGVGLLTGFFGVGGGFVIVPALVLVLRLPIQQAVGTSLMIVALNSATSLISRAGTAQFDWTVIAPFTIAAMLATLGGKTVADRLPARQLKQGFAVLLILVAGYTAWQSFEGLTGDSTSAPAGGANSAKADSASTAIIPPAEVEIALENGAVALDVRTPEEFAEGHLEGAKNIDLWSSDFAERVASLDLTQPYVIYCASGNRAGQAIELMAPLGFTDMVNGGGFVDIIAATSLAHA